MSGMIFSPAQGGITNLKIYQGKTLRTVLTWPQNVEGWSARLTIRDTYSGTLYTDFTQANGRVAVDGLNGKFTFSMTAADCAALSAPFTGVYEIEVTSDDGTVYRAVAGNVNVVPEVVR